MNENVEFGTTEYWQNLHLDAIKQRGKLFLELARVSAELLKADRRCAELELSNMMLEHRLNWLKAAETEYKPAILGTLGI